jgi:AcrR family transcriptional regulator
MRQIADALRLQKGSLYYYFRSKAEILFEAHDRSLDHMLAVLERVEADGGGAPQQLRKLLREHACAMVDGFHGTALALELDALAPSDRATLIAKRDRYESGVRSIVARGVHDGDFRPVDGRLVGFAMLGTINWMARWYRPGGGVEAARLGDFFATLFLDGLGRRAPARAGAGPKPVASRSRRPRRAAA